MPFKKISKDKFVSPSGRKFTAKQVKLYYATGGFKKVSLKNHGENKSGKSQYNYYNKHIV